MAEYRVKQADNQWVWLLDRGKVVEFDIQGQPLRMAGSHKDITRRKAIESDLRLSSQVLKSMNEAVVIADLEYQIQSVNPAFNKVTGFDDTFILNRHFISLAADKSQTTLFHQIRETIVQEHHWHGEVSIHTASDSVLLVLLQINQISDENGIPTHYVAVFTDITARKQAEHALQQMANYDTLTGLPNRTLFQDRLQQALIKARRNRTKVALFFLDLDRFKHINDSLGHHIGDLLLQAVAQRLQNIVRETDTVTRLGGDEFTIIMEDIKCDKDAKTIAEKILTSFNDAFVLADNTLTITTSIGISMAPHDADENSLLVQFADTAMYHAKARGRNNYQFYTTQLNAYAKRHVELEAALKQAIFYNELSLVYQPKFNIIDGTLSGVEALLRWHSATLGSISPSEFIPLAEETGFIKNIGLWVINSACAQIAHWQLQGLDPINVAINLSSRQLNEHIVEHIEQAISAFEIPAKMLELELTESAIMDNPEESVTILTQLKSLGLSIAVDDFGTGYSSLSYLKRFPIDTLKIDQEFVRDITQDPEDAAITNTIITLAHSLDLNVVAEGVETQAQYDFLASHNCDQVQGYLLSKPLTVTDCEYLLGQRQSQDIAG